MHKIMLMEDDATMLSLLHTLLEIEGFEVEHTLDFEFALDFARKMKPDLVLLDVNLRDTNGLEVLKNIRNDTELEELTVLMSSGMDLQEDCLAAGANDFILKPYMPEELVKKIKILIDPK